MAGCGEAKSSVSVEEEAYVEKKFGGITPKKPLISKDHERAYFDSADWVLGKQAANSSSSRAAVESLKPKLKNASPPASPSKARLRIWLTDTQGATYIAAHQQQQVMKSTKKEGRRQQSSD